MTDRFILTRWDDSEGRPTSTKLRAVLVSEGFEPYEWVHAPGTVYATHTHPHDEIRWIVEGRLVVEVAGEEFEIGPGDRLEIPAGTPHSARVASDVPVLTLRATRAA